MKTLNFKWWLGPGSNQRHMDFQSIALPTELSGHVLFKTSCGGRIWTYDLRVMSPTSFQTAPPRDIQLLCFIFFDKTNGWRWIRTTEAICSRFTVCPLWPLGNPSICCIKQQKPTIGLEPITCWLQISCSANWATSARLTTKVIIAGRWCFVNAFAQNICICAWLLAKEKYCQKLLLMVEYNG